MAIYLLITAFIGYLLIVPLFLREARSARFLAVQALAAFDLGLIVLLVAERSDFKPLFRLLIFVSRHVGNLLGWNTHKKNHPGSLYEILGGLIVVAIAVLFLYLLRFIELYNWGHHATLLAANTVGVLGAAVAGFYMPNINLVVGFAFPVLGILILIMSVLRLFHHLSSRRSKVVVAASTVLGSLLIVFLFLRGLWINW